ncbi:hypothetical protein [Roseovarius sp. M141]|uniref:hypothetical protein n=1 Tax=Roseovarius sp. M141 TaxID=2583806 RepID=UPI0020CC559A|nr:hypothetical protein [Roseovarius sp. M141]MCQ0093517.1 hypothetical protein [Roseovarius sp. M141]
MSPCAWEAQGLDEDPHSAHLTQDICDVTAWLCVKYHVPSIRLWLYRHRWQRGRQITGVHALACHEKPLRILSGAEAAFLAIGYELRDTGGEILVHPLFEADLSQHQVLRAYARIEAALRLSRLS